MSDTDSIKAKIGMKYELCRAYYKKMSDSKDKKDIFMNYGLLIRSAEYIIYMLNNEYVKGSTRNIPSEINEMANMPMDFKRIYNNLFKFDGTAHVMISAFGLISSLEGYLKYKNISFRENYELPIEEVKNEEITTDILTGTYEEIYSNWYNKMKYAVSNNHKYLSFVTMVSCQEFYDEMASTYNIPEINLIGYYDNDNLQNNVIAFEEAMGEWKKLYDMFNKNVVSYEDISKGAYYALSNENSKYSIIATGSEVDLALDCANILKEKNKYVNVISMPMMDVFEKQSKKYQKYILKNGHAKTISLEMLSTYGWGKYAKYNIGIDSFGKSGKASDVSKSLGFDLDSIYQTINKIVK
jgi:hypothetical protein